MTSDPSSPKDKSVRELFADTLKGDFYDNGPWEAIVDLHCLATPEAFQLAVEFCNSALPLERARGLNVLSQFGHTVERPSGLYTNERLEIALKHISDPDARVADAAAWVLAHLKHKTAIAQLIKQQDNPSADIRHAIAYGLLWEGTPEAISVLLKLTEDIDDDVRNWATFSFAQLSSPDSLEIREALHHRLADPFEEVREEALWALALRKDLTGLQLLLKRLEDDAWVAGDKDTAEEILELSSDATLEEMCVALRHLIETAEKNNQS